MSSSRMALAAIVLSALTSAAPPRLEISVPRGSAATIDGRIDPAEWAGSFETTMSDGSRLLLRHDGQSLYLAIQAKSAGFPSVCVQRGDTVRILHSSAALSAAVFVKSGNDWTLRQPFVFAMRSRDTSAAGKAAQTDYFAAQHWVATNSAMSRTEREMRISLDLFDPSDRRFALGLYVEAADKGVAWPTNHDDGCTATKTVQGFLPATLGFQTDGWARVTFR